MYVLVTEYTADWLLIISDFENNTWKHSFRHFSKKKKKKKTIISA